MQDDFLVLLKSFFGQPLQELDEYCAKTTSLCQRFAQT